MVDSWRVHIYHSQLNVLNHIIRPTYEVDYLHLNNLGQSGDQMGRSKEKHASGLDKHVKPSREPIETGIPD
jgi:hypothetical protein